MTDSSELVTLQNVQCATAADVVTLYRDLLGRKPESEAVVFARVGRPLLEVAIEIARSEEFHLHSRATLAADVIALYRALLRREPESETAVTLRLGRPLLDVATEIARSDEFRAHAQQTTPADVVRLYRELLLREPESNAAILPRLDRPPLDVAIEIAQSEEYLRLHLLQAANLRQLYNCFVSSEEPPVEWFSLFSKLLNAHGISLRQLLSFFMELALHPRGLASGYPEVERSLAGSSQPLRNIGSKVKVVVPTINSERWLGHLVDYYSEIGVPVVFAVDARTTDRTREILQQKNSHFIEVYGEHPRVESLMRDLMSKIDAPWLLRFDDDEVPSPALLAFADKAVEGPANTTWGFPRVYLRYDHVGKELQYSQFLPISSIGGADRQWRLFAKDGVSLIDTLHTPGFIATCKQHAPATAILFHFDWVLRSLAERIKKVRRYEVQDPVPARALAHLCLYEMVPERWHMFERLAYEPYVNLAKAMFRANEQPLALSSEGDKS